MGTGTKPEHLEAVYLKIIHIPLQVNDALLYLLHSRRLFLKQKIKFFSIENSKRKGQKPRIKRNLLLLVLSFPPRVRAWQELGR